ncbi:PleD family two-component system response regulator [Dyadobacter sp. Leaf189]|uniref:response regulator n=1 Tax=Dyadobacter sp. Leaf189 TaxID=1736295 RepID=UPI00138EDECF|nr:response regulator [Dyadobacter sp. Leaf189]
MRPVFIVDDSADYRFLLNHFLGRFLPEGKIEFFDGARSFLERVAAIDGTAGDEEFPALIMLDLNMAEMDGYELLQILKNSGNRMNPKWKDIPVVINSADYTDSVATKSVELGAMTFLRKSADLTDLYGLKDFLAAHLQKYGSD